MNHRIKIGSHVGMSGKDMFLGSVKEAITYGSNTFMIYTGAPQNTRRKEISELNIEAGLKLAGEHGITEFIVHAPASVQVSLSSEYSTFQLLPLQLLFELEPPGPTLK